MREKLFAAIAVIVVSAVLLAGCGKEEVKEAPTETEAVTEEVEEIETDQTGVAEIVIGDGTASVS